MWVTGKVAKVAKMKRILFSRYKGVDINKKCKNIIKQAKIDFEFKPAQNIKDDSKSFFAFARTKTKSRLEY